MMMFAWKMKKKPLLLQLIILIKKYQPLISAIEQQTLKVTIPRVHGDDGTMTEDALSSVVSSVHAGSCSRHQLCLQEKNVKERHVQQQNTLGILFLCFGAYLKME